MTNQEQQSAATVKPPIRLWEELNQQAKKSAKIKGVSIRSGQMNRGVGRVVAVATWEFTSENIAARRVAQLDHEPIKACSEPRAEMSDSSNTAITVGRNGSWRPRSSSNIYPTVFWM